MSDGWKIFYSYSHKDERFRDELEVHLAPLVRNKRISEWHDRKIKPGEDWDAEINSELNSAHLIILLLSPDFLASDYCFGVEVEQALTKFKNGSAKIVPILIRPCLWEESPFSQLQIIPRDAKAVSSWTSMDDALVVIAGEIKKLVSSELPVSIVETSSLKPDSSLDLVRGQVRSYAQLYERTRQRMKPSEARTIRMQQIFGKLRDLATASYPILDELVDSPSPGERLAAVAILQVFAGEKYLPFLVKLIGEEKPFVGYQAAQSLLFAVGALNTRSYSQLLEAIRDAKNVLQKARPGFDTDRYNTLQFAETEIQKSIDALTEHTDVYE